MAVSAVINTWNEEKNIKKCIDSISTWVHEIIVVDMDSTDATQEIAVKLGARVFNHPHTGFVEPARNFAIDKARYEWIFVVDADEEIHESLALKIQSLTNNSHGKTFFRIPRKNILFGKWIKHARWWPDYQIRLFKKGYVSWLNEIHSIPITRGEGVNLEVKPENAIVHNNYSSIKQFIQRLDRYTDIQAMELLDEKYEFKTADLFKKPFNEFLSRYLSSEGYKDGLHGFVVSVLQALSEFILYLKLWEKEGFKDYDFKLDNFDNQAKTISSDINYWLKEEKIQSEKTNIGKFVKRIMP